jgi:hypothetical protein
MQALLFLCAQSIAIDSRINTISVFHILEGLRAPAYPVVIPSISVVALLELDEQEPPNPDIELRFVLGGQQQLFTGPYPSSFQVNRKARAVAELNGLVIPAPGMLRISLHWQGRDIVSWNVACEQIAPPQLGLALQPGQASAGAQ